MKQNTCEVYPYWPRAAILETASFYLSPDRSHIRDYDALRNQIMNATNIADRERDQRLWDWIADFPTALSDVLACDAFKNYLEWEQEWLATQNAKHKAALRVIKNCLDVCVSKYGLPGAGYSNRHQSDQVRLLCRLSHGRQLFYFLFRHVQNRVCNT